MWGVHAKTGAAAQVQPEVLDAGTVARLLALPRDALPTHAVQVRGTIRARRRHGAQLTFCTREPGLHPFTPERQFDEMRRILMWCVLVCVQFTAQHCSMTLFYDLTLPLELQLVPTCIRKFKIGSTIFWLWHSKSIAIRHLLHWVAVIVKEIPSR